MKIQINLNEKDMDAIENMFFCEISQKQFIFTYPRLLKIWERLCLAMGDRK